MSAANIKQLWRKHWQGFREDPLPGRVTLVEHGR